MAIWAWTLVSIISGAWALRRTSPRHTPEPPYHIASYNFPANTQPRWKHWKTVLKICFICMISEKTILVGYETGLVEKFISSSFRAYVERTKRRSNVIWVLILRQGDPELRIIIEVKFRNYGPTPTLACEPQPKP
jgi:hypothetical protein